MRRGRKPVQDPPAPGGGIVADMAAFIVAGVAVGTGVAFGASEALRRHWVSEHLQPLFGLSIALLSFTIADLLVADEITAMLDPSTQAVILRDLKARQNARGFSLLFISHDIHLARKIADRVYVFEAGVMGRDMGSTDIPFMPQFQS